MTATFNNFGDGFSFAGLTASSAGPFTVLGGKYGFTAVDTGTIDATLQLLGPDGSTWLALTSAGTANATLDLPAGTVQVTLGTGTSLSASLARIPYRAA